VYGHRLFYKNIFFRDKSSLYYDNNFLICNFIKKGIWIRRCINSVLSSALACFITLEKSLKIFFPFFFSMVILLSLW